MSLIFFVKPPKDCQEGLTRGWTSSGVYTISPDGSSRVNVYCEQELDGGGWTVSLICIKLILNLHY